MNFTWFASAYDNDDVPYRLAVLVQIVGALILAAGVPRAFNDRDFAVVTVGYVVMRVALVSLWIRAAIEHREGRGCADPLCDRRHCVPVRLAGAALGAGIEAPVGLGVTRPARATRPRLGGAPRYDLVASGTHRRALRVVHDHRSGRIGARGITRHPNRARQRSVLCRSRIGCRWRPADRVLDVVDLLRPTRRASARRRTVRLPGQSAGRVHLGLRAPRGLCERGGGRRRPRRGCRRGGGPLRALLRRAPRSR